MPSEPASDETDQPVRERCRWLTSIKRRGGNATRVKLAGKQVRIWSNEHRAWWRPNRSGYTTLRACAGLYSFEDAYAATRHCDPQKRIMFEAAP